MDVLNAVSRWFGSKRTEMHHCWDHWIPKGEKKRLGHKLSSKALTMTGLGLGLSPTATHPEGGVLGLLKHLPTSGSSVSSDSMINHTFSVAQVTEDKTKHPYQSDCPPPPPTISSMAGHTQKPKEMGYDTHASGLNSGQRFPLLSQKRKAFCEGGPSFAQRMYQPTHPAMAGGHGNSATQRNCAQARPYNCQSIIQAPCPELSKETMASWNRSQGPNVHPNPTVIGHLGMNQQQFMAPCQSWSNLYPHSMQLPSQQSYQPNVILPQVRPLAGNNAMNLRPQYCPVPSEYHPVYQDQCQVPQPRVLPVGTPYVMCQSGSSPFISIIPLQAVQVLCPSYLLTGCPQSDTLQASKTNKAPAQGESIPKTVLVSASGPTEPREAKETIVPTEDTQDKNQVTLDTPEQPAVQHSASEQNEPECKTPEPPLVVSKVEEVKTETSKDNSICDKVYETVNCQSPPKTEAASAQVPESSEPGALSREQCLREKLGNRTINLTPAPRKKKKSRPSAGKRRSKRTPTKCILLSNNRRETETNPRDDVNPKTETVKDSKSCLSQCMSTTVAFVLGLDETDSAETIPQTAFCGGGFSFSISPSDSDSDLDNFFDESSDSEKGDEMPDFDCFDFFSDPHNPLNCNHLVTKPLKKSSSAPQLEYLANVAAGSSNNDESQEEKKILNFKKRQVKFANDESLVTVHLLDEDPEAYQEARKGHWGLYAIDRLRFKNRINEIESQISYIFDEKHRKAITEKLQSYE